ncbi:hypothetical protein C8R43DRAFT_1116840 [Mycena crocata]|nr:hypothetical protein C8R43DRAFT_1116840 [Mycena crocata]
MPLPPEICAQICKDVGRKDLVTLCRTSRLFGDQAQRMLYRKVDLSRCTTRALLSWCLAVTRRSQLAERVHTLSLSLSYGLSFSSDVTKIAKALSKCLNLKELSIHRDIFGSFGPRKDMDGGSIQGWIVTQCPFRLTKFSNGYFKTSFLAQFWTPQSEIRVLAIPNCHDRFPLFDDQLPHLVALEVGNLKALPADRPLQRIQLRWGRYGTVDSLSCLGRYSASLTTLHLVQHFVVPSTSTLQILDTFAHELPALLHLALIETDENTKIYERFAEDTPLSALAKFQKLQTFVIYCQRIDAFDDHTLECIYELDDPPSMREFGWAIMKNACPMLQRVVIAARIYSTTGPKDWDLGSKRCESTCTLTRTADGAIETDFGTEFDFRAVSRLWDD